MGYRHWFVSWFRPRRENVTDCPACTGVLKVCPHCEGNWRQGPCRTCRIGFVCTHCHRQWVIA